MAARMDVLLGSLAALTQAGAPFSRVGVERLSIAALCIPFAAAAALAAAGFGLTAVWVSALPYLGTAGTALVLAGILSILCGVLSALVWVNLRRRRPRPEPDVEAPLLAAAQFFKDHKAAILLAALAAGLRAGAEPARCADQKSGH